MNVQKAAGHEVHMVTADRHLYARDYKETFEHVLGPRIVGSGVQCVEGIWVHRLECRLAMLDRFGRVWLRALEPTVAEISPDLVIVHGMQSPTAVRMAWLKARARSKWKLICDSHAAEFNSQRQGRSLFYWAYRRVVAGLFSRHADAIVAIDQWSKEFLVSKCGIPAKRIQIVALGVDSERFKPEAAARRRLREEWGAGDDTTVFIYVGKVRRNKGVRLLLEAGVAAARIQPNIMLVVVGGGDKEYIESLKAQAGQQPQPQVRFYPHLQNTEIPAYYSAADVSVWPLEASIGTLEAQSSGLPLIVADTPVLLDRIRFGNGAAYRSGDASNLSAKMLDLASKPGLRTEMARKGRAAAVEVLDWRNITEQFMNCVGKSLRNL